ncbi:phosphocholine cytidylyltransferase family protein [Roseospira marina]|uniref:Phosphocholine cytidylyltransferase family protein n=1 Tax=Roseospira marina TaxID=140057 RepID=A0A5M6I713_9PROT|nr:phosphocholine cytidylyltransferase family protein [Roseospira marina]KAA5604061.1 phosphocholine cytidylyltransferase family protein [Roseospira marina]MBB4315856.1 choline kinase [Roseospira marina]MBB5089004.1 choline kinase [Roseospira marina]
MKAIVLSAGQGKRLSPLTDSRPKCLLPFGGRSLLEWQIRALASQGVTEVVVVVGFGAEAVEQELARIALPDLRLRALFNPFFDVADNIGSCYVALPEMTGDFLILNGDTLFEPAVLETLLARATAPVTVTIDRKARYDADDMKVCLDQGRRLCAIGKTLAADSVNGESIGMLLFRGDGGARFAESIQAVIRETDGPRRWYLSAIDRLARAGGAVEVVSIEGRQWGEIDYPADLERARRMAEGWIATESATVVTAYGVGS